jgi:transcriptional regulator GlxA family with amidase domain
VEYCGAVDLVGARLRPGVGRHALGVPASLVAHRILPLNRILPELDHDIARTYALSKARRRIYKVIERHLLSRWRGAAVDPRLEQAVNRIRQQQGCVRIDRLAEALRMSQRQLERRFLFEIGLSPKRWSRLADRLTNEAR